MGILNAIPPASTIATNYPPASASENNLWNYPVRPDRFHPRAYNDRILDIKSYAMAVADGTWAETSMRVLSPKYLTGRPLAHNALNDAQDQAELFRALRADAKARPRRE